MDESSQEISIEEIEITLVDSITSEHLYELSSDLGEPLLDAILKEGVLKEIPVFGTIYKLSNIALAIKQHFFIKKVYKFLFEIKDVDPIKRKKFIEDLENTGEKAGEALLLLIDRIDSIKKPKLIANLFKARVEEKISIEKFLRFSMIIERAFLYDLQKLPSFQVNEMHSEDVVISLVSLGLLLQPNNQIVLLEDEGSDRIYEKIPDGYIANSEVTITKIGKELIEYGLKDI